MYLENQNENWKRQKAVKCCTVGNNSLQYELLHITHTHLIYFHKYYFHVQQLWCSLTLWFMVIVWVKFCIKLWPCAALNNTNIERELPMNTRHGLLHSPNCHRSTSSEQLPINNFKNRWVILLLCYIITKIQRKYLYGCLPNRHTNATGNGWDDMHKHKDTLTDCNTS